MGKLNETELLVGAISSMGAGAAISLGRKILALVAINASPKIKTTINGAMYWRKNAMVNSLNRGSIDRLQTRFIILWLGIRRLIIFRRA